ncbi:MAG TPA: hypothetical protein VFX60_09015 [Micromonospora sp.]|nr:hypothetical protein [Micromonospora sp.]
MSSAATAPAFAAMILFGAMSAVRFYALAAVERRLLPGQSNNDP